MLVFKIKEIVLDYFHLNSYKKEIQKIIDNTKHLDFFYK